MSSSNKSPRRSVSRSRSRSMSRSRRSEVQGDEYRRFPESTSSSLQPLEMESTNANASPLRKITTTLRSSPPQTELSPSRSNSISSHSFSTNGSTCYVQSTRMHKGFSTPFSRLLQTLSGPSIIAHDNEENDDIYHQMELSTSTARTDLCSLSLFGILQSDHTRYLFTHNRPPTLFKRLCLHLIIPVGLFVTAGWISGHIRNDYVNNLVCTTLIWSIFLWICVGCARGRKKRVMVREEILWRLKRREEKIRMKREGRGMKRGFGLLNSTEDSGMDDDYEYYSEDEEEYERHAKSLGLADLGQSRWEMNCAHRMCGCYPSDVGSSIASSTNNSPQDNDYMDGGNIDRLCCNAFASPCCSCIPCGNGSYGCHLQFCGLCAVAQEAREATLTVPRHLRMIDYITMEPFLLYYPKILDLRRNKNQSFMEHCYALSRLSTALLRAWGVILILLLGLSLWNAVGYWKLQDMIVLCATFLQAFLVMWAVHWGWHRFDLSVDAVIKYFACGFAMCTGLAFTTELLIAGTFRLLLMFVIWALGVKEVVDNGYGGGGIHLQFDGTHNVDDTRRLSENSDILHGFFQRHPFAQVVYVLVSSYLVAGFIDELCKYFGFLMIDHPDFCSEKELTKAHSSLPLQLLRDRADANDDAENEHATVVREDESTSLANFEPSNQRRSQSSIRAGVTVAMVAVALGFACCENILHIFIYNRSSLRSEIGILVVKSLFPIHPLCAAIQSIQVCKRDMEKNSTIGVGKIIFASVLLHGTYDAALLFISQSWKRSGKENYFYEGSSDGKVGIAITSGVTSMIILSLGVLYYMIRSKAQYRRLRGKSARAEVAGISLESGLLA